MDKIIHDYKSIQGLDVFDLARILLTYEQDEGNEAQINIMNALRDFGEIRQQYLKDFKL